MKSIDDLIKFDIDKLKESLINNLANDKIKTIDSVTKHFFNKPGKLIRAKVLILVAKHFEVATKKIINLATVVEYFHAASLLHDDVIDEANTRRNQASANIVFGNKASILVGDYIFSKAFEILSSIENTTISNVLARTSGEITQGEILQLENIQNINITKAIYFSIISGKTGALFESACLMGPIIANAKKDQIEIFKKLGLYLGNLFQITDDILDFTSNEETLGKNVGADLKEGKITLPLIQAIKFANKEQLNFIKKCLQNKNLEDPARLKDILDSTNAIKLSYEEAYKCYAKCLTLLSSSKESLYKDALLKLAKEVLERIN